MQLAPNVSRIASVPITCIGGQESPSSMMPVASPVGVIPEECMVQFVDMIFALKKRSPRKIHVWLSQPPQSRLPITGFAQIRNPLVSDNRCVRSRVHHGFNLICFNRYVCHQIQLTILGDQNRVFKPNAKSFFLNVNTWLDCQNPARLDL